MKIFKLKGGLVTVNKNDDSPLKQPWFQGVLLLCCVVVAMLLANLPFTKDAYENVLHTHIHLQLVSDQTGGSFVFPTNMTVEGVINDILMVVFFFTVGLEIKREIAVGELSSVKKAVMPIIAAFGGVVAPALIFTAVNAGTAAAGGWGIPTATDIAFAVCILSVLGDKVPVAMKVFLTALAIADDLIAILVVALFYGGEINLPLLGIAFVVVLLTLLMRKIGEKRMFPYLLMAFIVWVLFYYSGIHATMSGVVMAFLIPSTPRYSKEQFIRHRDHYLERIAEADSVDSTQFPNEKQRHALRQLANSACRSVDMSQRVEHALAPWVNFIIMPIFAIANAGVEITDASYFNVLSYDSVMGGVGMGIFFGLLLGKPLGITLFSWIAVKLKVGDMPNLTKWPMFFAVACLGGIGFTMSIFVDTLSFGDQAENVTLALRNAGKIAVLMGSVASAIVGSLLVNIVDATNTAKSRSYYNNHHRDGSSEHHHHHHHHDSAE